MASRGSKAVSASDREKAKRLNRIRGQVEAISRAVEGDAACTAILQQATACRGALDGFIAEIIEDHVHENVVEAEDPAVKEAAEEFIDIVHSYLMSIKQASIITGHTR